MPSSSSITVVPSAMVVSGLMRKRTWFGTPDRVGVGEDFELHRGYAVTAGFCQPRGGVTLSPTSFGPQVPGS